MNYIYPIQEIRSLFPALCRLHNGNKAVYLDGPGGSQVVATAITAMTNYMRRGVANTHGIFAADGDYYAETLAHRVGVDRIGGWIRVGFAPYNTEEEAELLVRAVREIAAG